MSKGIKIALIVIAMLIAGFSIAALIGFPVQLTIHPFGNASSSLNQFSSTSSPSANPMIPATQVTVYAPPKPASSTAIQKGSCWTNSIAAPFRADAWRCAVGNGISDPCFQIASSTDLLCGVNPLKPSAPSTFVLRLTQPLPKSQPVEGLPPSNWAWLVELEDGTLCSPFTGTLPFTATGESGNYACAPGSFGKDAVILGDLDDSGSIWKAEVGTLKASTSGLPTIESSSTVAVKEVWK